MKLLTLLFIISISLCGCLQAQPSNVTFTFTATGDDGDLGQASFYDIRYSTDTLVLIDWDSASQVIGEPSPKYSGSFEEFTLPVDSLESGVTYYFAIRVADEENNWSGNSNTISMVVPDYHAPNAIMNFNVRF